MARKGSTEAQERQYWGPGREYRGPGRSLKKLRKQTFPGRAIKKISIKKRNRAYRMEKRTKDEKGSY